MDTYFFLHHILFAIVIVSISALRVNGMDARFLKRHQSAKVVVAFSTTKIERGIHHEDYYGRHRFGKGSAN